jgi:uncharacterized protein (UPF0332 family)
VKPETQRLLAKAQDAIEAAELLLHGEKLGFAAGRAYYAMFYIAEALLFEKGMQFRKHSGVHAAFGKYFAKPGLLDRRFHTQLLEAFESRLQADYGVDIDLPRMAVAKMIRWAEEFLAEARRYLEGNGGPPVGQ